MRAILTTAAMLLFSVFQVGCASIVSGLNQSVSVTTKTTIAEVQGAKCTLQNDKGQWFVTTLGSVLVRRAFGEMSVNCTHGELSGFTSAKSATKAMAFGNIIFGGIIGAGVDMGTGAAYDYPNLIAVDMQNGPRPVALNTPVSIASGRFQADADKKAASLGCYSTDSTIVESSVTEERYFNSCNNVGVSMRCDAGGCVHY